MDSEATNGSSDSNTSGSALLSRKGLFGKSGVLNQNLESSIATEKEVLKPEEDKSNGDGNDGANTSGSGTDQLEVASNEDTTEEDEPHPEPAAQKETEEEKVCCEERYPCS
ncbi:hypothetical protein OESDEN_17799 [Oesophagostomum dentatum]|uniref:Uncharacterized protein n=1 Tax=Oesophagostomum dentatum TaxID=61180 RepID=A0A0B1SG45_OESDE|nr:hypothetical protein OESDEN_17799 [Oesophagostomum dentatum]